MSAKEEAVALKEKGNTCFKGHDWIGAVKFYTEAIEAYDQEPSFYTNRAQVRFPIPIVRGTRPISNSCAGEQQAGSIRTRDFGLRQGSGD
jgi:hypothetical protein